MSAKFLWAIAFLVWLAYIVIWDQFIRPFILVDARGVFEFIDTSLSALLFSAVVGLLIALVPMQGLSYGAKWLRVYPLTLVGVCLLFGLVYYFFLPRYERIQTTNCSDCRRVKDGSFKIHDLSIERKGNVQVQINGATQLRTEYTVTWLNDCEYQLANKKDTMRVKIVSVDDKGYDCYVQYPQHKNRTSQRLRAERQ